MSRKAKYSPKSFESLGQTYKDPDGHKRTDTSANIAESMLTHKAFIDLLPRQRMLYVICKAQYFGKRKPSKDYPETEQFQGEDCFYLNFGLVQRYGLYSETMAANFYKDLKVLENHGFIKKLMSGKNHRTKSVFQFSGEWKFWKEETKNAAAKQTEKH